MIITFLILEAVFPAARQENCGFVTITDTDALQLKPLFKQYQALYVPGMAGALTETEPETLENSPVLIVSR
ncbi:hypothetical protein BC830DRAFT_1124337 [Chytriomyces sp. MP71]|nr:hypothetical protein BC830DRAFT_1124337 [Chytriomyces sp. MP71]